MNFVVELPTVNQYLLQWKIISTKHRGIQFSRSAHRLLRSVFVDRSQLEVLSDNHECMCLSTAILDPFAKSKI